MGASGEGVESVNVMATEVDPWPDRLCSFDRLNKARCADIPQSTKEVPRCRIVMRYVDEQTKSVGANLGAITVLVRRPGPPNRRAQAIIILPGTQFSPARQVPLAELHAPATGYRATQR